MQPIVNDFFCGCGGMGVGFLNAGYKIAGAWDFDKYGTLGAGSLGLSGL